MRLKTLAVSAGVSVPLLLSGSAEAGFVRIKVVGKANPFGLFALSVYAEFDRPGEDHMLSVSAVPGTPAGEVFGGTYYQHAFGGDTAPSSFLVDAFPSLAFDTFVTIGVKSVGVPDGQPADNLVLSEDWPGFGPSSLVLGDASWSVTADDPQGDPFDPVNSYPGDGSILIGQFTTADGTGVENTLLLEFIGNGVVQTKVVGHFNGIISCDTDEDCFDTDPCDGTVLCDGDLCLGFMEPTPDCNNNGRLDSCDIDEGSDDCDANGVPDECDPDQNSNGTPDACECLADLDGDGVVGILDFLTLLAEWGVCDACPPACPSDLDFDCQVGIEDFLALLEDWGPCP